MHAQLENDLCCTKHSWGGNEKIALCVSVHADNWTAELAIIAWNDESLFIVQKKYYFFSW